MLSTFHVPSRIVANISESSLLLSQQLFRPAWLEENITRKLLSLSLELFFTILLFQVASLIFFSITMFSPYLLAATKQLNEWYFRLSVCLSAVCLSVCLLSICLSAVYLSVRPSHLFYYVPIIVSSWNFMELLPMTRVRSMQKIKVRGQRSRSQRSQPNLTVSRP